MNSSINMTLTNIKNGLLRVVAHNFLQSEFQEMNDGMDPVSTGGWLIPNKNEKHDHFNLCIADVNEANLSFDTENNRHLSIKNEYQDDTFAIPNSDSICFQFNNFPNGFDFFDSIPSVKHMSTGEAEDHTYRKQGGSTDTVTIKNVWRSATMDNGSTVVITKDANQPIIMILSHNMRRVGH